jgi:hypothetical protein
VHGVSYRFLIWSRPALVTAASVAFFYVVAARWSVVMRPIGSHGPAVSVVLAIAMITLAISAVLVYGAISYCIERKRSQADDRNLS